MPPQASRPLYSRFNFPPAGAAGWRSQLPGKESTRGRRAPGAVAAGATGATGWEACLLLGACSLADPHRHVRHDCLQGAVRLPLGYCTMAHAAWGAKIFAVCSGCHKPRIPVLSYCCWSSPARHRRTPPDCSTPPAKLGTPAAQDPPPNCCRPPAGVANPAHTPLPHLTAAAVEPHWAVPAAPGPHSHPPSHARGCAPALSPARAAQQESP